MKLFKKIRKGFTLIELVVVIAVIAILSAVSVVSYVAITNRAKESADQQAVAQMNRILIANDVMDLKTINDVYAAFAESDLSIENYQPLFKNRFFFWDSDANRIVYTDANYKVLYPENMKDVTKDQHQWYSLTQSLTEVNIATATVTLPGSSTPVPVKTVSGENNSKKYDYAVATPEQLYTIGDELKDAMLANKTKGSTSTVGDYRVHNADSVTYIVGDVTLDLAQDLDLMGAAFNFCVEGNFTINGHGHKIKGIVNNKDFVEGHSTTLQGAKQKEHYGSGLLGYISSGKATFKDVTIENCVFGGDPISKGGGLVGYVNGASVEFDSVKISGCDMAAFEHSCGGFIGDTAGTVGITLKGQNVLENCNLKVNEGTNSDKECYGAGYFIGRDHGTVTVTSVSGGSFAQSGNTKLYANATKKINCPSSKASMKYWDDSVVGNAKFCNVD